MDDSVVEVDVAPCESCRFTGAESQQQHREPQRMEPVLCGDREKLLGLLDGECAPEVRATCGDREFDDPGDVAVDELASFSMGNCFAEHGAELDKRRPGDRPGPGSPGGGELVESEFDVFWCERTEPLGSDRFGEDLDAPLVDLDRALRQIPGRERDRLPVLEYLADGHVAVAEVVAATDSGLQLAESSFGLCLGGGHCPPAGAIDADLGDPSAGTAIVVDGAFAVASFGACRHRWTSQVRTQDSREWAIRWVTRDEPQRMAANNHQQTTCSDVMRRMSVNADEHGFAAWHGRGQGFNSPQLHE